ncbi:hypothetical protein V2H45_12995 [Tumidithrix elongata RA019]|uniref:SMODS-associating 2TM beta-strand rich effector domain-containing protein n=2 Tax=Tumidithrix TaxID=3088355 RepID=A0AAW9PT35_9CYAN|nr:hypothetical protein [Tumidithrix elongata RA019]
MKYLSQLIWAELISGEQVDNGIFNLILFVIFCLLSIATYRLEKYQSAIVLFSAVLWYLDRLFAKQQYFYHKKQTNASVIDSKDGWVSWKIVTPKKETRQLRFHLNNISHIAIKSAYILGGAFEEPVAMGWQVSITLKDEGNLLIYEEASVVDAIARGRELANYFKVSIAFLSSEGRTNYSDPATESIVNPPNRLIRGIISSNAIRVSKTAHRWHIFSRWTFNDSPIQE